MAVTVGLLDQEELVQSCHDLRTRELIEEAFKCYKSGAFRATIVISWLALVCDYIYKLDDLGSRGDAQAKQDSENFFRWQSNNSLKELQEFERRLLEDAHKKYEFLNDRQFEELKRLQIDRHNCVHPSVDAYHELYKPAAELARYHLRNAVEMLCKHPPMSGKVGIEEAWKTIESNTFPRADKKSAIKLLSKTAIPNMKPAACLQLAAGLMSVPLKENHLPEKLDRYYNALKALHEMRPEIIEECFSNKLLNKIVSLEDHERCRLFRYIEEMPFVVNIIGDTEIHKLKATIEFLDPRRDMEAITHAAYNSLFFADVVPILSKLSSSELGSVISNRPTEDLLNFGIDRFSLVDSFNAAGDAFDNLILPYWNNFSVLQIERILQVFENNDQIYSAYVSMPNRLTKVFALETLDFDMLKDKWISVYDKICSSIGFNTNLERNWSVFTRTVEKRFDLPNYNASIHHPLLHQDAIATGE